MKTIDLTGTWDALMTVTGGTQAPIGLEWAAVPTVAAVTGIELQGRSAIPARVGEDDGDDDVG